jgi:hypothetical protein
MKRSLATIATILAILIGLFGLETPLITPAVIAIGLGGLLDPSLLQPLFIGLVIIAIYGQFYKARQSLSFMPLIVEFVAGVVTFLFVFPFKNLIVGYAGLLVLLFVIVWPLVNKKIQKKKVVKIKV